MRLRRICRSHNGAGALGFRDFSGLLAAKENRTGSRQTLLPDYGKRPNMTSSHGSDDLPRIRAALAAIPGGPHACAEL
jgi:hypothetical protein